MNNKIEISYPEDTVVNVYPKPVKHLKDSHARVFLDEMIALGMDKELSGNDLRVLLAIIGNLGYENKINISQQELGDQLNIHQVSVSKSLKKLISKGYLQVVDVIGRQNIYQFNPNVAFRSRAKNLKDLKRAWDKETLQDNQNIPIDFDLDLSEPDFDDLLEEKVSQLSKQYRVSQNKVRSIILALVNQALETEHKEDLDIPY